MTFIGGFLHSLPFPIPNVHTVLTWAYFVVGVELVVIALIRHKYFKTSFALSFLQVIVGGGALPAVRVDVNPTLTQSLGLGMEDIRTVRRALHDALGDV